MELMVIYRIKGNATMFNLTFKKEEDLKDFMNTITRDNLEIVKIVNNFGY